MFTIKSELETALLLFNNMGICQLTRVAKPTMGEAVSKLVDAYRNLNEERVLILQNSERHYVIHVTESGSVTMYSSPTI